MQRFLLIFVAMAALCGTARAACTVQQRSSVAFTQNGGRLLVPLVVNGIAATFILDSGADRSLITPAAVRRLNIRLDKWVDTTLGGIGGVVEHANADPDSFSLGGLPLQRHTITHDVSLTVGDFPQSGDTIVDGLLGRDFLSPYDLQLDMVARRLTLFAVSDCRGRFVPWQQPYIAVVAKSPLNHALVLPIVLDGHRLSALLDTGASASMLTLSGMIRMGLRPAMLAHDHASAMGGVGRQTPLMYRHRFARMQVGDQVLQNPMLWVSRVRVVPIVDALLGADWLAAQSKVWLSFTASQVFFIPR